MTRRNRPFYKRPSFYRLHKLAACVLLALAIVGALAAIAGLHA